LKLQVIIDEANSEERRLLLNVIVPQITSSSDLIGELMIDKYGSFVVWKIIIASTDEQRLTMIRAVAALSNHINIACDPAGSGALQLIFEQAKSDEVRCLLLDVLVPQITPSSR
jgi:hypothetical protein